jgi:nitrogen fixation NifU-like protein
MTLHVKGKTLAETEAIYADVHKLVTTGQVDENNLSDLAALAGVHQFPARIKCATLGWHAALNALKGDPVTATTETHKD